RHRLVGTPHDRRTLLVLIPVCHQTAAARGILSRAVAERHLARAGVVALVVSTYVAPTRECLGETAGHRAVCPMVGSRFRCLLFRPLHADQLNTFGSRTLPLIPRIPSATSHVL